MAPQQLLQNSFSLQGTGHQTSHHCPCGGSTSARTSGIASTRHFNSAAWTSRRSSLGRPLEGS
ncbi:hypothetical protein NC653_029147 [Populus alba x Populus x berolinensis]|uniref:Uncharacterized protein n=1 Tax=Populus alba x Populus x berolinensis TaxID=444605 RepID=A0AAD6M2H4_9ROSI|nr:hypothetical protein NC653_029147 [Populus alba x Populus x berolinensis]